MLLIKNFVRRNFLAFLCLSDPYIPTALQPVVATKEWGRWMCVCGSGQREPLPHYTGLTLEELKWTPTIPRNWVSKSIVREWWNTFRPVQSCNIAHLDWSRRSRRRSHLCASFFLTDGHGVSECRLASVHTEKKRNWPVFTFLLLPSYYWLGGPVTGEMGGGSSMTDCEVLGSKILLSWRPTHSKKQNWTLENSIEYVAFFLFWYHVVEQYSIRAIKFHLTFLLLSRHVNPITGQTFNSVPWWGSSKEKNERPLAKLDLPIVKRSLFEENQDSKG